jgi:hypothetical protein
MKRMGYVIVVLSALWSVGAAPVLSRPISRLMRQKLTHTQRILEAVVTSDWVALETQTRELDRLTDDPAWTSLKFADYAKYSMAFKEAIRDLRQAAAQRDLDLTPKAYAAVTLRCVDCHRYMARARIAR